MADIMKMGKNPNYMGSWDLMELPNKEVILTIAKIVDESVVTNGKSETCTVCYFTNKAYKPMIFNPTNKKRLAKLLGTTDTEKLKGKSIIIHIEKVKAFGDVYDALRVKLKLPPLPKETVYTCSDCNQKVTDFDKYSAHQIAGITQKRYGAILCNNCSSKRKNSQQEVEENGTDSE